MIKVKPYGDKILDDCPDCGCGLLGNICHNCEITWKFEDIIDSIRNIGGTGNV